MKRIGIEYAKFGIAAFAVCAVMQSVYADEAAEFKDYTLRKLQGGGVLEAFDNPLFETPDVPGMRAGDPEKEWLQHCGYNGSGGLRLIPTSDKQVKHDFNCKIKSLVPGKKYILSVDVRTVGKAYCHIYWSSKGKANWFPKKTERIGGWVRHEVSACVPLGKSGEDSTFRAIVTPQEGWKKGETYVEFDNLEMREDVPEWYVANTWPIHNQIYNDYGRIRLYSDFLGEYVQSGHEIVYLCELLEPSGKAIAKKAVKDVEGVITVDFGRFGYAGQAQLRVSLMDRTARQCLGVRTIDIEAVSTPEPKPDVITVDEIGRIRLGGKLWMPIGFYTSFGKPGRYTDEKLLQRLREMRESGYDFITEYWCDGFDQRGNEIYDMLHTNGFHMLYNLTGVFHHRSEEGIQRFYERARNASKHPAVVGFYTFDELPPSWAPFYERFRRGLQKVAPEEITWYSNIAAPAPFLISGDLQGNGCYPVTRDRLNLLHDEEGIARAAKCRAAAWLSYGQCFNYANYSKYKNNRAEYIAKGLEPTAEQMLTSVLLFATYGSRAFQFFIFDGMWAGPVPELYEGRWRMAQEAGRTLRSLEPWIMSANPIVEVPHKDVKGKTRIVKFTADDGRELVVAIGLTPGENEAEFEFNGRKRVFKKGPVSCEIYRN